MKSKQAVETIVQHNIYKGIKKCAVVYSCNTFSTRHPSAKVSLSDHLQNDIHEFNTVSLSKIVIMKLSNLFTVFMVTTAVSAKCIDRGNSLCSGAYSFRCAVNGDPQLARCCDTAECICEKPPTCIDA